jgi:hypothetical protein
MSLKEENKPNIKRYPHFLQAEERFAENCA